MEHLSNDHENRRNQHENSHKLRDKTASRFEFDGESIETETTTTITKYFRCTARFYTRTYFAQPFNQ